MWKYTNEPELPSYLFDFFHSAQNLRLDGGGLEFRNAPLAASVLERFCNLYAALGPLRSHFHLVFYATSRTDIPIQGDKSHPVLNFSEAHRYYTPGSTLANTLLENEEFSSQLATLKIQTSIWSILHPWLLHSFASLPKLIMEIDTDAESPHEPTLPLQPSLCPALVTLVRQAKHDVAYVTVETLLRFADQITSASVSLELCHVVVIGSTSGLALVRRTFTRK